MFAFPINVLEIWIWIMGISIRNSVNFPGEKRGWKYQIDAKIAAKKSTCDFASVIIGTFTKRGDLKHAKKDLGFGSSFFLKTYFQP